MNADLAAKPTSSAETKVLVFNSSHPVLYALTGSMEVRLDGRGVATLAIGEYVQLPVSRGTHKIELVHWDLFPFKSSHSLEVGEQDVFVEVSASAISNELRVHPTLPEASALPRSFRAYSQK